MTPPTDRARQVEAPLEAVRSALEDWVCGHPVSDGNALGFCELLVKRGYRVERVTPEPAGEVARLRQIVERERTAYMEGIAAIHAELQARGWLAQGRGSYEWDDDRYQEEFGRAIDAIVEHLNRMERETSARSSTDCPQDDATIRAARAELSEPAGEWGGEPTEAMAEAAYQAWEFFRDAPGITGGDAPRKRWHSERWKAAVAAALAMVVDSERGWRFDEYRRRLKELEADLTTLRTELTRRGEIIEELRGRLATPSAGSRDDDTR